MVTCKYLYLRVTINTYVTLLIFKRHYFAYDPVGEKIASRTYFIICYA